MRDSSSVRLIWSLGRGPSTGGFGRLAAGLFPARLRLRLPRREPGFVLRLLARMAFLGPRLDLRPRLGQLAQTLLAPRQFVRYRHAVGNVRRVGRFGFGHQIGDFGFQLRLDLAGVFIRQRTVPAGVGVNLRAVQRHRPHLQNAHLPRQLQHLNEQSFDLLEKAPPEGRNRVVVGMIVGRDEPERHRVISRTLQLAARKNPRGIAVNQNAQQHARMVRRRPGTTITAAHRAKIEPVDNLHDKPRQVFLRKPFGNRGRQQKPRLAIDRAKIAHQKTPAAPARINA